MEVEWVVEVDADLEDRVLGDAEVAAEGGHFVVGLASTGGGVRFRE